MDIKGLVKRMALATPFAALSTAMVTTSAYAAEGGGGISTITGYVETAQTSMGNLMGAVLLLAAVVVAGISLVLLIYNIRQGKDYKKALGFLIAAIIVFIIAVLYGTGTGGFFRSTGDTIGNAQNVGQLIS